MFRVQGYIKPQESLSYSLDKASLCTTHHCTDMIAMHSIVTNSKNTDLVAAAGHKPLRGASCLLQE